MKSQLHYLSASHCAAPVTFGLELPVMCTVCAVLPISLTKVKQLRTSTLGYVIATHTELPVMCTVCAVLSMPLSGVKSLFTLMGRLGWGTLLVTFVVEFVSSSNSVGVALSQPRVAGVVRYPG